MYTYIWTGLHKQLCLFVCRGCGSRTTLRLPKQTKSTIIEPAPKPHMATFHDNDKTNNIYPQINKCLQPECTSSEPTPLCRRPRASLRAARPGSLDAALSPTKAPLKGPPPLASFAAPLAQGPCLLTCVEHRCTQQIYNCIGA